MDFPKLNQIKLIDDNIDVSEAHEDKKHAEQNNSNVPDSRRFQLLQAEEIKEAGKAEIKTAEESPWTSTTMNSNPANSASTNQPELKQREAALFMRNGELLGRGRLWLPW